MILVLHRGVELNCEESYAILQELGLQEVYDLHWKAHKIPIIGTIEITYRCNFKCIHCYADERHEAPHMSYEEVVRLVDEMSDAGTFFLTISGGEPLVHPDFKRIYRYIRNKGIFVEVFTNGTLISEDIADLFYEYPPINVDITVYGASDETYQQITGMKNGYSRMMQGIENLRKKEIHFTLKTSALRENADDVPVIRDFAKQMNVSFRYSYQVAPTIEGDTYNYAHRLSPQEIVERESFDIERANFWSQKNKAVIDDVPYGEVPVYNCKTAKFTFCISADSLLSGCIHDRVHVRNLKTESFLDAWQAVNECVESIMITKDFPCAACEYLPFCNTCPADAEREFKNINCVDQFNCELARLRYKHFK